MSIRINKDLCSKCKKCSEICPGNLIVMEAEGAKIECPDECWGCCACLKECKHGAIEYYLNEDAGGKGGYMKTLVSEDAVLWHIHIRRKEKIEVRTDRLKANKF